MYRWLILCLISFVLAHWAYLTTGSSELPDWGTVAHLVDWQKLGLGHGNRSPTRDWDNVGVRRPDPRQGQSFRQFCQSTRGGPHASSVQDEIQKAGVDFLILDEGEITLPLFVEAIETGKIKGVFSAHGEKPDITQTPIPRYDLLELDAYAEMAVQFSRGCPFQCEFCDIIVLYGRKPRTKTPMQLLQELQALYDLGWRGSVFVVDDNFIGNKRNVKLLLRELIPWMQDHSHPFSFYTEASVDLAQDKELLDLMFVTNFRAVFLGIEAPDSDSLNLTKKYQNTRNSLIGSVQKINQSGIRVMAGFILGFDGEKTGAGDRIIDFVEETAIPQALFSMLQALPNTALWNRLHKEGRLLEDKGYDIHQTTLTNFIPTRPIEELAREYVNCFWQLYEPQKYLGRVYRHYIHMKTNSPPKKFKIPSLIEIKALATIFWRQGIKRSTRFQFWNQLLSILIHNRKAFKRYLSSCAQLEHFIEYRQIVKDDIEAQIRELTRIEVDAKENFKIILP